MTHQKKSILISMLISFMLISTIPVNSHSTDDSINHTYTFQEPLLLTDPFTGITSIESEGLTTASAANEPMIPSLGCYLLLPAYTHYDEITITTSEPISLGTEYTLRATPHSQPLGTTPEEITAAISPTALYPEELYTLIGTQIFRGYTVLILQLHPIHYINEAGELYYYKEMSVTVTTTSTDTMPSTFRGLQEDLQELQNNIDNPETLTSYQEYVTSSNAKDIDMLIISECSMKDAYIPLKDAHDQQGLSTYIVTINDIGSNQPEDVRDYIRDAYQNDGIDYVLIGADHDILPSAMLYVEGLDEGTTPHSTTMPSDIYFACLDGTYNYDGDSDWGEPTDGDNGGDVDLYADVYVGRACASDYTEAENFVTKTVNFINCDPDDAYLKEVLLAGEYLGDHGIASYGGNYLDQLIDGCSDDGYATVGIPSDEYQIDTLYDRDSSWSASTLVNEINQGIHILNHLGHANYYYNLKLDTSDISSFTNTKTPFIYSQGCMAGGFDEDDCIAEYFTVKTPYAAHAVIMNARYGWFWSGSTDGDSQRLHREFWDAVFSEDLPQLGKANHDSKEDNLHIVTRSCIRWAIYETNLLGDPAVSLFMQNRAPMTPETPHGPYMGYPNTHYTYTAMTTDPEGDNIRYIFDWGDGTNSGWIGSYPSGTTATASHNWANTGTYEVRVKAKDLDGEETDWSDSLLVNIVDPPVPTLHLGTIDAGMLYFTSSISNQGTANATYVQWEINCEGGLVLLGAQSTGSLNNLNIGDEEHIQSDPVIGMGKTTVTITATTPGSAAEESAIATMILFYHTIA